MKIRFAPSAIQHLNVIGNSISNRTGFITGWEIGGYRIVEQVLPLDFNESTIDEVYSIAYSQFGDKMLGVFFNMCEPFKSDWFIETIILKIQDRQTEFFICDASCNYLPISEEEI